MIVDSTNPISLSTNHALISHVYNNCGARMLLHKSYPFYIWIRTKVIG